MIGLALALVALVGTLVLGRLHGRRIALRDRRIAQLELLVHQLRCGDLFLFFDGELPADRIEAFRDHLIDCQPCQAGLHDLVQLEAGVSALALPEAPR